VVNRVLDVSGLSRAFGSKQVVTDLSLALDEGERVALRGPNGSGKTTILRCITGAVIPDAGEITVRGHPAGSMGARHLLGVSLSQERSFYMRLTGLDNLLFFARLRHSTQARAMRDVRALEEELEIAHILQERLDRCSTGMLQQLAFARAMLGSPSVFLLDEPTRSLDTGAVGRVWDAVERRAETAVLIATHREDDLDHCHSQIDLGA